MGWMFEIKVLYDVIAGFSTAPDLLQICLSPFPAQPKKNKFK